MGPENRQDGVMSLQYNKIIIIIKLEEVGQLGQVGLNILKNQMNHWQK